MLLIKDKTLSTQSQGKQTIFLARKEHFFCQSVEKQSYSVCKKHVFVPQAPKTAICQSAVVISNVLLINRDC